MGFLTAASLSHLAAIRGGSNLGPIMRSTPIMGGTFL
jgi:hypothetical protein